jgi:hypothetical protein
MIAETDTDEHDASIRDNCSTVTPCRQPGLSLSGSRSTAADTHEQDVLILNNALTTTLVAVSGFEVPITERRCADQRGVD